jgi:hypothetical protein
MASQRFTQWSGLSLALGGTGLVLHYVLHPLGENSQFIQSAIWIPAHVIGAVSWVLILAGTFGFYSQYSKALGRLGLVGFVLAFAGGVTRPGELLFLGSIAGPVIASQSPSLLDPGGALYLPLLISVGFATFVYGVGYLLMAIRILPAQVVPPWSTWLVILSILLALATIGAYAAGAGVFIVGSVAGIIFSMGLFGWGYSLWSNWKPESSGTAVSA